LNTHLAAGGSIVLTNKSIISDGFWQIFNEQNVTNFNGVPYHYEVLKKIGFLKKEYPHLQYLTQAGGKLSNSLISLFGNWSFEKKIKFFVMYGQTEATARISYLPFDRILEKIGSVGFSIPNGSLEIQDIESGILIEQGNKVGELVYKGKNVMMGYSFSANDLWKGDELNGVLKTGDLAYFDNDGYAYITGRLKRFIKLFGNRIGLDEIEKFLIEKKYNVICTGIDDFLMLATRDNNSDEIRSIICDRFHLAKSVVKVMQFDSFPINSNGKINYQEIINLFQNNS